MTHPSGLQLFVLLLATIFVALLFMKRKWAWSYGRVTLLLSMAAVMLLLFVWLIAAAFEDAKVINEYVLRQALVGVPTDLVEAGRIDGCGEFRIYLQLAMPLVRPMTGAFCLITFLATWNSFLQPNIFLQTQSKLTLPVVLNQYIGEYSQQFGVFLAGTLIAIIPPAVLFLALQREFIAGLTSGAVKQ